MSPRAADLVRKACAGALSVTVTVLLFRVMFRLADGRASALDVELWLALGLLALGFAWVRAARRVHAASQTVGEATAADAPLRDAPQRNEGSAERPD